MLKFCIHGKVLIQPLEILPHNAASEQGLGVRVDRGSWAAVMKILYNIIRSKLAQAL